MSEVLANSIVVIAIVVSAGYAAWRLGPRKMRDALRMRLSKALPSVFGQLRLETVHNLDVTGSHSVLFQARAPPLA